MGVGVIANVLGEWHHLRLVQALDRGQVICSHASSKPSRPHSFWQPSGSRWQLISFRYGLPRACSGSADASAAQVDHRESDADGAFRDLV